MLQQSQTTSITRRNSRRWYPGFRMFSALLLCLLLVQGCQKENLAERPGLPIVPTPALSIGNATYDANYDVLVFSSFQDVRNLADVLGQLQDNYPYNQGNEQAILNTIQNIQNNSGQTNINNFENLLLASYPLSDNVLEALIDLNDNLSNGLPGSFMSTVLTANVPYSYDVEQAVSNANLQNAVKSAILNANDNTTLVPDHAYNDFLSQYSGFNSLYTAARADRKAQLDNGLSPGDQQFTRDFVDDEFLQLIMNKDREVYIDGALYKMYKDCALAVFLGSLPSATAEKSMVDPVNGTATPPTGMPETMAGIPLPTMEAAFPMNYARVDPENYDPVTNGVENHQQEFRGVCPEAAFNAVQDPAFFRRFNFNRYDPAGYLGTYFHYWTFGDGTGSFASSPTHEYAADGVYTVKLTVFKEDCGCWDTYTERVVVGAGQGQNRETCYSTFTWIGDLGSVAFDVDYTWESDGSPVYSVEWDFGDGNTGTGMNPGHTYSPFGEYTVTCTVTFNSGCQHISTNVVTVPIISSNCCDIKDEAEPVLDPFGDGKYKLEIRDFARGITAWIFSYKFINRQTFLRKKSNGKWREQKADHQLEIGGSVFELNSGLHCSSTVYTLPYWHKSKDNDKSVRMERDASDMTILNGFGMDLNSVIFKHYVKYGDKSMPGFHWVRLGDC